MLRPRTLVTTFRVFKKATELSYLLGFKIGKRVKRR